MDEGSIPGTCESDSLRETGRPLSDQAVETFVMDYERNSEACMLDGKLLQAVGFFRCFPGTERTENRPQPSEPGVCKRVRFLDILYLALELGNFFLKRHS